MSTPEHGTENRYTNWECRCDRCRTAHREYARQWRDSVKGREPRQHGIPSSYLFWRCRCDKCRAVWNAYQRDRYARRKAASR